MTDKLFEQLKRENGFYYAVHEMGHALAALHHGFVVEWVSIDVGFILSELERHAGEPGWPNTITNPDNIHGMCRTDHSPPNPAEDAKKIRNDEDRRLLLGFCIECFSGPTAQKLVDPLFEHPSYDYAQDDKDLAIGYMLNFYDKGPKLWRLMNQYAREAADFVSEHREQILGTASMLMTKRALMKSDLGAIPRPRRGLLPGLGGPS